MARDCEELSANARAIFEKIKAYFPPNPWGSPQWTSEGKVFDNGWYDLRKSADRERFLQSKRNTLGYMVQLFASSCRNKLGSLDSFTHVRFSPMMRSQVEPLLLVIDLNFQIETSDLIDC